MENRAHRTCISLSDDNKSYGYVATSSDANGTSSSSSSRHRTKTYRAHASSDDSILRPGKPGSRVEPGTSTTTMDKHVSYHHEQFKLFKERAENEKKSRRRKQNNESSRRSRERKRFELESLQRSDVSNQLRISELEGLVRHLTNELKRHDGALEAAIASAPTKYRPETNDTRPGWFGSAF